MKIVNKSIKKIDSIGIITGRPLYTDDLVINNNSLIVKLLRSPHPLQKYWILIQVLLKKCLV